jgi:hypothetical protein
MSLPQLSRRQFKSIEHYRQHPKETAGELFEFEAKTVIPVSRERRLGVDSRNPDPDRDRQAAGRPCRVL